jgi:CRP-like cAMP-binding protein
VTESKPTPWYWAPNSFFGGTPPELQPSVLAQSKRLKIRRGASVFSAADPADYVYFLEQGLVKIYHLANTGEVTIFWFCTEGELFGPGGITGAEEQDVYAQAASASVIYAIARPLYEQLLFAHPVLGLNVIKLMGARLRVACEALTDKITQRAEARVARILLRLARNWGIRNEQEIRFGVTVTQQEIANMAGTCRQTSNTIFKAFERQGLIRFEGRTLIICQPVALSALTH